MCTYYKRRRNAHLLHENISSIRLRLEEMERYNTTTTVGGVNGRGGGGNEGSVIRLGERDQDWEFLESLFGSSTSGNAANNNNERAGMAVTIATLGIDGGNDTERRRQIMSDILGGMSVRNVMEREQRRKRERGRRLVSLLKECSLWVKESHLIPKEGGVVGSEGGVGGGEGCFVNRREGGEGRDIELGNIHTVQNETETDGVENKAGEDYNDEALKSISNQDATVNEGTQVRKSDIDVESPPPMNGGNEEESCQQPTADETSDEATTANNNAPDSTITTLESTMSTALQPTDHQAVDAINTQSSLLPSAAADNTAPTSNNNILSLYQTDDLFDDDDDDDNKYSALCLPCSSTHKDATTTPTLSVAQSAPPPQSAIGNTEPSTRLVPSTCAICLLSYSPGCYVTWSSNPECIHVFHRDCILVWLLKKEEPLCPCCRREFVSTSALNAETTTAAAAAEPDNEDSRLEQYRRSIMLLERSQSMASRRRTSSSSGRSARFARMSLQEPGATSPQWDSVGLGRVRHF